MKTKFKVFFLSLIPLFPAALTSCSKEEAISVMLDPLQGIWGSTRYQLVKATTLSRDEDGIWTETTADPLDMALSPSSATYTILKFSGSDVYLMKGEDYINGTLGEAYPYSFEGDRLTGALFTPRYEEESYSITDLTETSFILVHTRRGGRTDNDDSTVYLEFESRITFSRLR